MEMIQKYKMGDFAVYSAGSENETNRERFYNNHYYTIGWSEIGDLRKYIGKKQELEEKIKKCEKPKDCKKAISNFMNLKKGDILILRTGYFVPHKIRGGTIYAIGLVTQNFEDDDGYSFIQEIGHAIPVQWVKIFDEPIVEKEILLDWTLIKMENDKKERILKIVGEDIIENVLNTDLKKYDKNIILYGPPGTGKTYNSVIYAVAICKNKTIEEIENWAKKEAKERNKNYYEIIKEEYNKLKDNGRIAFTTFHQSYSYEDFIEGIKPKTNGSSEITYEIQDGIFKKFCNDIKNAIDEESLEAIDELDNNFQNAWDKLVKVATEQNNTYEFTRNTGTKLELRLKNHDIFEKKWSGDSKNSISINRVYNQWKDGEKKADDLEGGKAWNYNAVQAIINELKSKYGLINYNLVNTPNTKNYVFIIDEINRGNISKIFGELITLIEENKRKGEIEEITAMLPYSGPITGKEFSIPNNVYIIGTMNTADRSIALLDTALRRRFKFIEMLPEPSKLPNNIKIDGVEINLEAMLDKMNKRIEVLYDREHTIGHAFFMKLVKIENPKLDDLKTIFTQEIIPLLQEYFYDDYSKIKLVLGNNFIIKNEELNKSIFNQNVLKETDKELDDILENQYKINENAFDDINNYKEIYKGYGDINE